MARKFKIGNKVEIVKQSGEEDLPIYFKKGIRGTVIDYEDENNEYPYVIKRRDGHHGNFNARELKLIKRKEK